MISDEKKIWKILSRYDISKIYRIGPQLFMSNTIPKTLQLSNFSHNINRVMVFYPDIIEYLKKSNQASKKREKFFDPKIIGRPNVKIGYIGPDADLVSEVKYEITCESTLILLITSLEAYFGDLFKNLSKINTKGKIERNKLKDLANSFRINIDFSQNNYDAFKDIPLSHFLPKRLDFQQKQRCRNAFLLFDIDLVAIDQKIWQKIYSKDRHSYSSLRHSVVHIGKSYITRIKVNLEIIENCILDIVKFVYLVEKEVTKKYPQMIYLSHKKLLTRR